MATLAGTLGGSDQFKFFDRKNPQAGWINPQGVTTVPGNPPGVGRGGRIETREDWKKYREWAEKQRGGGGTRHQPRKRPRRGGGHPGVHNLIGGPKLPGWGAPPGMPGMGVGGGGGQPPNRFIGMPQPGQPGWGGQAPMPGAPGTGGGMPGGQQPLGPPPTTTPSPVRGQSPKVQGAVQPPSPGSSAGFSGRSGGTQAFRPPSGGGSGATMGIGGGSAGRTNWTYGLRT